MSGPLPGSSTFSSLSERDFQWYYAGNIAFFMAMQMQFVLRGYLAVELTDSVSSLGLVAVAITGPMLIAAPIGGVIADRVNKKFLLIATQALGASASLFLSLLIIDGSIQFWHLLAVSFVTGIVFSFNMPARSALVPLLVPQHKLMNAISLQAGGQNLTRIIAPAMAGVLIAPLGIGWVYMLTGVMFGVAVISEFHLPKHGLKAASRGTSFFREFTEGLSYVRRDSLLGLLIVSNMLIPFFAFPVQQMLPIFALDVFDTGASGIGLLAMMSGVGGLTGAILAANMDRVSAKGRYMFAGGFLMSLTLFLFAVAPTFGLAMLFLGISGIGQMLFQTTNNTVMQARAHPDMRGRVNSLMLTSFGIMPLGVLPITAIADEAGVQATVAGSCVVLAIILSALFIFVEPLRNLRVNALAHANLSPAQAAALVAEGKLTQEEADRESGALPARG